MLEDRYPERRIAFPGGVTGLPDLTYSTLSGFRPLTLDLYLPAGQTTGGAPVIVYVHGGGWTGGHTRHSGAFENWPNVLASLAARGYVVASVNYRLSAEAPSPAAEQDVKSAVRWLRANATRFGVDKRRIGIWGGSAGGQLAALAGTSCGVSALAPPVADAKAPLESDCVQAVVAWYGVFDFVPLAKNVVAPPNVARYLGCEGRRVRGRQHRACKCGPLYRSQRSAIPAHPRRARQDCGCESIAKFPRSAPGGCREIAADRPAGRRSQLRR